MKKQPSFTLVFGLTADPPHRGHEQVIRNSFAWAENQGLTIERFVLIPTYQPNLIAGKKQPRTPYKHRRAMCQIMADEVSHDLKKSVQISDIEKELFEKTDQKSYSFDTLNAIQNRHPESKLLFVLSADHFAGRWPKFRKWHQWQALVQDHGLIIHQRPGHRINMSFINKLKTHNSDVYVVTNQPSIEISSTLLRKQIKQNQATTPNFLSEKIIKFAKSLNLYIP